MSMHPLGSQQLDEGLDFLWLNLLAPRDPPGASTSSTLATPEGEEKRDFHSNDLKQLHKPHNLAEVQTTGLDVVELPANA